MLPLGGKKVNEIFTVEFIKYQTRNQNNTHCLGKNKMKSTFLHKSKQITFSRRIWVQQFMKL